MRVQRLRIPSLPVLPSQTRYLWFDEHWKIPTQLLTHTEIMLCVIIGVTVGWMMWFHDWGTAAVTSLIGLALPLTLWFFDMLTNREVLATKTYFTDFPIHSITSLDGNLFAISGGGGGMSYGIPDQCSIVCLAERSTQDSTASGRAASSSATKECYHADGSSKMTRSKQSHNSSIAFHVINNSSYDEDGRDLLKNLDMTILQSLTPHSFWGLASSSSGYLCGGVAGIFHVFRLTTDSDSTTDCETTKPANAIISDSAHTCASAFKIAYPLLGDLLHRSLVPLGSHKLIEQPFMSKKKLFIQNSTIKGNKIGVFTEDNRLAYYAVINDFLCFVASAHFEKRIIDVRFDPDGESLIVLMEDRKLLQYATPTVSIDKNTLGAEGKGVGAYDFIGQGGVRGSTQVMKMAGSTWQPIAEISLNGCINMQPRHLVIFNNGDNPTCNVLLIGTPNPDSTWSNASMAYNQLRFDPTISVEGPWGQKLLKNIGGCPAVAVSDQYVSVVGNSKFVVLEKKSLAVKHSFYRHDQKSKSDNTLPVTAAGLSRNEKFLLVGTADYSVVVAPLMLPSTKWLGSNSHKIMDYFNVVLKVSFITMAVAFFVV